MKKINEAIERLMREVMNNTIDKLLEYLSDKVELTDEIKAMFDEYRKIMFVPESIWEKKRCHVPSNYNIFIKNKILELKASGYKGNFMKVAVEAWKEKHSS